MSTAQQIIEDAADLLEIKSGVEDLEEQDYTVAMRRLNRMMTAWAGDGLNLGYSKVNNKTDDVSVPDWSEEAVIAQLAIRLAPAYGVPVSPALQTLAIAGFSRLIDHLITLGEGAFPTTLPIGSGNFHYATEFYADETAHNIESDTEDTITDDTSVALTDE